jgi:hypothetical protein
MERAFNPNRDAYVQRLAAAWYVHIARNAVLPRRPSIREWVSVFPHAELVRTRL